MPTLEMKPRGEAEPELNLLLSKSTLEEPLWKSLFQNLDEFFFPKKLPPLVLTSKPVPVKLIAGIAKFLAKEADARAMVKASRPK